MKHHLTCSDSVGLTIFVLLCSGDGPNLRNFVLGHGALRPLLELIKPNQNVRQCFDPLTFTLHVIIEP